MSVRDDCWETRDIWTTAKKQLTLGQEKSLSHLFSYIMEKGTDPKVHAILKKMEMV